MIFISYFHSSPIFSIFLGVTGSPWFTYLRVPVQLHGHSYIHVAMSPGRGLSITRGCGGETVRRSRANGTCPIFEGYANQKTMVTSNKTGNVDEEHLDLPHLVWGRFFRKHYKINKPEDVAQRFLEPLTYFTPRQLWGSPMGHSTSLQPGVLPKGKRLRGSGTSHGWNLMVFD